MLYENAEYMSIFESLKNVYIDTWTPEIATLFLKSYIHLFGENSEDLKDLMFLACTRFSAMEFSGLWVFHLEIPPADLLSILVDWKKWDENSWKQYIKVDSWDFRYIIENTEKLKKAYAIENMTRDSLCLFVLSCFELYDLKSTAYPLYKWLFNLHFKSSH